MPFLLIYCKGLTSSQLLPKLLEITSLHKKRLNSQYVGKNPKSLLEILQCIHATYLQKQKIRPMSTVLSPAVLLCETVFSPMLASILWMLVGYCSIPVMTRLS